VSGDKRSKKLKYSGRREQEKRGRGGIIGGGEGGRLNQIPQPGGKREIEGSLGRGNNNRTTGVGWIVDGLRKK